jgi:hypothetical protein
MHLLSKAQISLSRQPLTYSHLRTLEDIVNKCQEFSKRPLLIRIINQQNDKDDIARLKEELQRAIQSFNVGLYAYSSHSMGDSQWNLD